METNPYNHIGFRLALNPKTVEAFVIDNNIDVRAFMVKVKKSNSTELREIKNIINGVVNGYTKGQFIKKFEKT